MALMLHILPLPTFCLVHYVHYAPHCLQGLGRRCMHEQLEVL